MDAPAGSQVTLGDALGPLATRTIREQRRCIQVVALLKWGGKVLRGGGSGDRRVTATSRPLPVCMEDGVGDDVFYSENRFAQEEGEVSLGCVGIYVNDVYAMTAHDSCMCTRQLHGLFQ
jgi:hypothetical protein